MNKEVCLDESSVVCSFVLLRSLVAANLALNGVSYFCLFTLNNGFNLLLLFAKKRAVSLFPLFPLFVNLGAFDYF